MKIPMSKDTVRFLCWMAANDYAGRKGVPDGAFNSACFAAVWSEFSRHPTLDGEIVRLILVGRPYIEDLKNGHWKLLDEESLV